MNITFISPPIQKRCYDWEAHGDDYEPGDPVGYGETEAQAIKDYNDYIDENTS